MSIKIEGGDGSAENVIKAGASNELLYNDKEVLLKENLDLGLLPPDLARTQKWELMFKIGQAHDSFVVRPFTVPEDGWIVNVEFEADPKYDFSSDYIKIDGYGELGVTPSQIYVGEFESFNIHTGSGSGSGSHVKYNTGCPYLVKKGQEVTANQNLSFDAVYITFAPFMSV